jgi:hypothetical protein
VHHALLSLSLLALAAVTGCTDAPGGLAPSIVVNGEVGTVAEASWSRTGAERTRIVLERAGLPWLATDWQEAELSHVAPLFALPPESALKARVEVEDVGLSDAAAFTTGSLSPALPGLNVEGEPAWGGWTLTSFLGAGSFAVLLDETGQIVWWYELDAPRLSRVRARPDGQGVWLGFADSEAKDSGGLRSVSWAGKPLADLDAPAFSHDFSLLPDGRVAYIEFDRRELPDGAPVWGNRIVEADDDGVQSEVWSAFDSWEPGVDGDVDAQGYWSGINALDYDENADAYLLSARGLSAIVALGRDGVLGEQIGGPQSDYSFPDDTDVPKRQHQFQRLADGLLVFDNRDAEAGSRVLELELDEAAGTATSRWSYQPPDPLFVYALGDVDRRPDGSTLVAWCTSGVLDHVSKGGDVLASVRLDLGAGFGFIDRMDELPGLTLLNH